MASVDSVASASAVRYLRLHLTDSIGPVMLGRLIKHFGSIERILSASMNDLAEVEGIGPRRSRSILENSVEDEVERELEKAARASVRIICWEDAEYPPQLRHCDDPPICLYIRGRLQPEDAVALAIVGSRKCTRYGHEQANRFGALLAGAGFTVVSGLARGIDGQAHEGALAARGRTVAVLGSGVDLIYPPEHVNLAERILESGGALLSEDPLGSPPSDMSFPRRNRIIAGMTLGTMVVEAGRKSGALITARLAGEYNREVFALPGRVDNPAATGTNHLIREGAAKLVACLEDVLDELGDVGKILGAGDSGSSAGQEAQRPGPAAALDANERAVLEAMKEEDHHIDDIALATGMLPHTVAACLTTLQLKGRVAALPGNRFASRQ